MNAPLSSIRRLRHRGFSAVITAAVLFSPALAQAKAADRNDSGGNRPSVPTVPTVAAAPSGAPVPGLTIRPTVGAAAPGSSSATASATAAAAATTTTAVPVATVPFDLRLCRTKLQLLAQLDRQRAKVLTNLARADTRYRKAVKTNDVALAAAMKSEVDSNQERLNAANADIAQVLDRCR